MGKGALRWFSASVLSLAIVAAGVGPGLATAVLPGPTGDGAVLAPGTVYPELNDDTEARLIALDNAFITRRTAGDTQLSVEQAGEKRAQAAADAEAISKRPKTSNGTPITFNAPWTAQGPSPILQIQRSDFALTAESGRIGALAIRKNGEFILGAAQGGIWTMTPSVDANGNTYGIWVNRTDNLPSLSTGALAIAPSNDLVVYDGTGEGALSGDSYFGNGILKSVDGGTTWAHVSGDFFAGVSIARLAVDPKNANHLYAAVLRGRGGDKRTSPPVHSAFGIWESTDGAKTWTLLMAAPNGSLGATELRMDPQNSKILYSSFWGDKIYKSTDGGKHWTPIMNGLPTNADFAAGLTRFNIGLSHPAGQSAVLYTGFDWVNTAGVHQAAQVFKSTDQGATWVATGTGTGDNSILNYCATAGSQCFYDNVVEVDPNNPNIVFLGGSFGYNLSPQSGGIFRSDDGGATWKNLGWDQHPDFHALAFDPNNSAKVLIGSDGGVWYSTDRGGRPNASDPLNANTWQDLNGNPDLTSNGLAITQFSSIANNPTRTVRFWGGTQDNGTLRKIAGVPQWYDMTSGDGGQAVVDPTDWRYIYGEYPGISPYRITDGGLNFFNNPPIVNGINTNDRSDFYAPLVLNQINPNQLYLGSYRLYRTDNAKAPAAGDVLWKAISPDLTSGCPGAAPNGARACVLSAIGVGGGTAVYTGSLDGFVYLSPDAQVSAKPTWVKLGSSGENGNQDGQHSDTKLPQRPVSQIAVDRSNYRIAYISYAGFNAATPKRPGHVFATKDGGQSFKDITGNLPDSPVNSLVLDPSYPNTLYAGTDVGPFVTYNGGRNWYALGTGFPTVSINQIQFDTFHRVIAAGTHGRSAYSIQDSNAAPALVLTKTDAGTPVGPGSMVDYTITIHNIGNADATGVKLTDPIPANTKFVSADSGGTYSDGKVTWSALSVLKSVPAVGVTNPVPTTNGGSTTVHLRVQINANLRASVKSIVNDGFKVTSAQGVSASGSPTTTPIAPANAVSVTPATQTDGARDGQSVSYQITITNLGFKTDSYNLSSTGGTFAVSFFDPTCTTAITTTPSLTAGMSTNVCVKVMVPSAAANGTTSVATVIATSVGNPAVSASATIKTIAVAVATLVVDDDSFVPATSKNVDVNSFYTAALASNGIQFSLWDLGVDKNLPLNYLKSFTNVVWFTGNSYPNPITLYEPKLQAFLDNGGRLFMSGQDLLDQTGGTTSFVKNYLHVNWVDATMNDIPTANVNGAAGTIAAGAGKVPIDSTLLGNTFMDEIGVNPGATPIFTDDSAKPDGLSFKGTYRVVFLSFPFEEYGTAAQRATFVGNVFTFFTTP
jgi:uncharacterized repeat protein (TIGR01451 family)